jgi:cytochrome c5
VLNRWFLIVAILGACMPRTPPHATAADAQRANVALAELEEGRKLLVGRCAGCHKAPLPEEHPVSQWPTIVAEMAERSKIDARQQALIAQYLVTMAPR